MGTENQDDQGTGKTLQVDQDALATAVEKGDTATYLRLRAQEDQDKSMIPPAEVEKTVEAKAVRPGDGGEAGAAPDKDAEDADGGASDKGHGDQKPVKLEEGQERTEGDEGGASDELPDGVKRRLTRQQRALKLEREAREKAERELQELKQKGGASEDDQEDQSGDADAAHPDKPFEDEDEYLAKYPFPEEDEYLKDAKDKDKAMDEYLADIDRWEKNLPLRGGRFATGKAKKPAEKSTTREPKSEEPALGEREKVQMWGQNLSEMVDESDDVDENLYDDFTAMHTEGKFPLSFVMLEWLAENDSDEDAIRVMKAFVDTPRKARQIFAKPARQQAELLGKLAQNLKSKPKGKDKDKEPPLEQDDDGFVGVEGFTIFIDAPSSVSYTHLTLPTICSV